MSIRFSSRKSPCWLARIAAAALLSVTAPLPSALAQSGQPELPATPGQTAPATLTFTTPNPADFTAGTPTTAEVNAFLKATWGYNLDLAWQVEAIAKTPVAGISKVTVAIGQKSNPSQAGQLVFFTLPDGQHIISQDEIAPFGAHPFDSMRKVLQAEANGPARGSASKDLLIVEFADFQCPHCKDAEPTMDRIVQDFPNARVVFESFPLPMHSEAPKAAAYGVCVQKAAGDEVFFKYADAVFAHQATLTPEASDQTLKDVIIKIGLNPAKIAACSTSALGVDGVKASLDFARKLEVRQTPWLFINGRGMPVNSLPYEQLKAIIAYQAIEDGTAAAAPAN